MSESNAISVISSIVKMFRVSMPRVVFGDYWNAFYDTATKTIYLPTWASRELLLRMAIHEAAHHVINELRKSYGEFDEELFAKVFEDVFYSALTRGGSAWASPCSSCGFPVVFYSEEPEAVCPKCYTAYREYPRGPSIGKAVALAAIGALAAYALADHMLRKPEYRDLAKDPRKVAAGVAGLVGFLLGLVS